MRIPKIFDQFNKTAKHVVDEDFCQKLSYLDYRYYRIERIDVLFLAELSTIFNLFISMWWKSRTISTQTQNTQNGPIFSLMISRNFWWWKMFSIARSLRMHNIPEAKDKMNDKLNNMLWIPNWKYIFILCFLWRFTWIPDEL